MEGSHRGLVRLLGKQVGVYSPSGVRIPPLPNVKFTTDLI